MTAYTELAALPRRHYGAILIDPPTKFSTWSPKGMDRSPDRHYPTLTWSEIAGLPVGELAARDCVLLLWTYGPILAKTLSLIPFWGFEYKTLGFNWVKVEGSALFLDRPRISTGYWTRPESELCLLATRGQPKRLDAGVRQVFLELPREHSRKPRGTHVRVERLVAGPYLEMFSRTDRVGWDVWGNEVGKFGDG